jgi:hypothetical protein
MPAGSIEAIIRPSVDSTAEASMSAVEPFSSLRIEFSRSSRMGVSFGKSGGWVVEGRGRPSGRPVRPPRHAGSPADQSINRSGDHRVQIEVRP